ncbi:protein HGH1 homolog isoform X2 [Cinclus cinclus]|uniref:protein HGH1 homolog isoform X2 n=1 Tax=Cinclus cinclus TaxID=127875 RepID=UPI002E16480B
MPFTLSSSFFPNKTSSYWLIRSHPCIAGSDWLTRPSISASLRNTTMAAETKNSAMMEEANHEAAAVMALSELTALLSPSSPAAPAAAEAALSLSGSPSGRALLAAHPEALSALAAMAASASSGAHSALAALVNASSEPSALEPLLSAIPSLLHLLPSSGAACGVLANLSRDPGAAARVVEALGPGTDPLLRALSSARPPAELGALLCNLSQAPEGRRALLERSGGVVRRMLALVRWKESAELRRGVVGALRNCCFDHREHEWLLGPEVEAMPTLLLPLVGHRHHEQEVPVDLQFLPPEHQREEEPEIRKMLLETLLLLTATEGGRSRARSRGTSEALRDLHGRERDARVADACRKVIQVLIGDEPEAGMENLLEVTIPEEVEQRLRDLDREQEREWEREGTETGQ